MYRRILLCYDGSAEGRNALREGAEIALATRAETHLLAILRTMDGLAVPDGFSEAYFRAEDEAAGKILAEGVDWLKERGLDAHGHIAYGDPIAEIPLMARELAVDLIVVGHRNRSRLARWWSDAEDATLLELSPCSILVAVVAEEA
jgi:nucleotide-binding universal stress UspA family protein